MEINELVIFLTFVCLSFICNISTESPGSGAVEPEKAEWLCADPDCSGIISEVTALKNYQLPSDIRKLTFKRNDRLEVLKKPFGGKQEDYWGRIKGKLQEGFIPQKMVRETLVKAKELVKVVTASDEPQIVPTPTLEVIDGTTLAPYDDIPPMTPTSSQPEEVRVDSAEPSKDKSSFKYTEFMRDTPVPSLEDDLKSKGENEDDSKAKGENEDDDVTVESVPLDDVVTDSSLDEVSMEPSDSASEINSTVFEPSQSDLSDAQVKPPNEFISPTNPVEPENSTEGVIGVSTSVVNETEASSDASMEAELPETLTVYADGSELEEQMPPVENVTLPQDETKTDEMIPPPDHETPPDDERIELNTPEDAKSSEESEAGPTPSPAVEAPAYDPYAFVSPNVDRSAIEIPEPKDEIPEPSVDSPEVPLPNSPSELDSESNETTELPDSTTVEPVPVPSDSENVEEQPPQTDPEIPTELPTERAETDREIPTDLPTESAFLGSPGHAPYINSQEEVPTTEKHVEVTPSNQPDSGSPLEEIDAEPSLPETDDVEQDVNEETTENWFSSVTSALVSTFGDLFSRSPSSDEPEEPAMSLSDESCTSDSCPTMPSPAPTDLPVVDFPDVGDMWSYKTILVMGFTSVVVLVFTLGYYYLENLKREVELVTKYNALSGKLFIEQKEKEMLQEQLSTVNDSIHNMTFDTSKYEMEIDELKRELAKSKEETAELTEKEKEIVKKYVMVEKNYSELRNVLSSSKQKGERMALIADIRNLKDSLAANSIEISSLKEQLSEKKEEIKLANLDMKKLNDVKEKLEKELEQLRNEEHSVGKKYQDSIIKLEETIEKLKQDNLTLEDNNVQLIKKCETLSIEKELAESALQKAHGLKSSKSLSEWLDAKELRVASLAAEKKLKELEKELSTLKADKGHLEGKEKSLASEVNRLNELYEKAEKEKIEALTKLQVLSDYFKEKETQLQEELGTKEALWVQKQSDDHTIYEQMRALREEIQSYKNQNETLKKEILDQETSYKKLVTSAEEKSQEHWVSLRHCERRLKEAQMEAATLRNRLTALESTGEISEDKMNKTGPMDSNGELPPLFPQSASSPPFMLYPGEFLPPPPLVPPPPIGSATAPSSRPPPLGRISSPPLVDFTPPPPLLPYEMFLPTSPTHPSASHSHPVHKPQPRHKKDSQSSNPSSDSPQDKPPRRAKR